MPKVYAQVHGCPSNTADYEASLGLLKQAGFEVADSPEKADVNLLFTCTVKLTSSQRMIGIIKKLAQTGKPLIVAGCMPKTEQRVIEKIAPDASMVGPDSIEHMVEAVHAAIRGNKVIFVVDDRKEKTGFPRIRKNSNIGIIPIASGCLSNCSYCLVKFARGRLKSYPIDCIVAETKALVADGCREIWLTSEDNSCYGLDIGTNLVELIKAVSDVSGDFKIRVGMMNPTYVKDEKLLGELIEAYKDEKVQKFLHLPLQSGSDKILMAMKRGYTVSDFEKIVAAFRAEIPDIYISTDVIVGFPGETEEDFQKTIALIEKIKPGKVNVSKFGARPGTEAAGMKQLPNETVSERSKALHEMMSGI